MNEEVLEEWMCDINGYTYDAFAILKTGLLISFIYIADVWFCSKTLRNPDAPIVTLSTIL